VKQIKVAGIFTLKLTNSCGVFRDTFEIKTLPPLVKVLMSNVPICAGETVKINAKQSSNGIYNYNWNDGFNGPQRDISQPGTYILKTSSICGNRSDTLVISLKLSNNPIQLKDTIFCSEPSLFTQKIKDYSVNVLWTDGDTSHIKTFTNTGKYYVNLFNSCGGYTDSFEIIKGELPVKVLKDNEYFCQGSWITLKGRQSSPGVFDYEWDTGVKGPELVAKNKSTFTLTTRNACGSRTDQVNVFMANCDCEICIPNAFTPTNSDGRNDVFKPSLDCKYANCLVKESYMRIYNRWGEKLYDAPVTEGWDGTFMGSLVPEGTYIYLVHIIFDSQVYGNRIQSKSGVFTLLSGKN
jgi:gliding motility-associated-like protein